MLRNLLKSSVRPIEIGRKLLQSIDSGRTTNAEGKDVSPNQFTVLMYESDRTALGDLEKPLMTELIDAATQYATDAGFVFAGALTVSIVTDAGMKPGKFEVRAAVKNDGETTCVVSPAAPIQNAPDTPPTVATPSIPPVPAPPTPVVEKKATLVMADGTKIAVKPGVLSIGRSAESSVPLNDTNASRRHAEIRSRGEGTRIEWYLVDLGSTNGTMLNGVKISGEQRLRSGDALMFGSTAARFEVA